MSIKLRYYQEYAVEQIRQAIREGHKSILVCAPTGAGKCLGKDTPVMMADGSIKKVQNVVAGDLLMGDDGTPREVYSTTKGSEMMYRITPAKGDSYIVNASHLLSLKKTPGSDGIVLSDGTKIDKNAEIVAVRADVFYNSNITAKHCLKGWRSEGIRQFHNTDYDPATGDFYKPIPPYILGAWLGDGAIGSPMISKPMCNMVREWIRFARSYGYECKQRINKDKCPSWYIANQKNFVNLLKLQLDELGLSKTKYIPSGYKYGSWEERVDLVAGLIDSDGHISHKGCDFISKYEQLANDFVFVCRSLGLSAYVSKQKKCIKSIGFEGWYWRVSVSGDLSILPMRDKKAGKRKQKKRHLVHGINVEMIGEGDYYGFSISGNRLFLLGDFTVTHNTLLAAFMVDSSLQKGRRSAFIVDRINLVDQTSAAFDGVGIDHGIMQASHWRFRPSRQVQICSVQTLARRQWPEADVVFVDECHTVSEVVKEKIAKKDCIVIGLTATPFTKGLGQLYSKSINVTTTNKLIEEGFLSKYRIFAASEPNMDGVKVVRGEWDEKETSSRALEVVGDCVQEYLKNTPNEKFICSGVDVAHVEELHRQFMAAGVVCANYTYKVSDEERAQIVEEFRKPDSYIRGLITVTAATKGFDVPDITCVIMARPLRKSLAEHIQFWGRGLRVAEGKDICTILDHSGNCTRFWDEVNEFFEYGCLELDDGKKKPKPKKDIEDIEDRLTKCGQCKTLHKPMPFCPNCGHEYPKKSSVVHVPGTLKELVATGNKKMMTEELWPQIVAIAKQRKDDPEAARKYALATYKKITNVWPTSEFEDTKPADVISSEVARKIKSLDIAYYQAMKKAGKKKETA